MEDEKTINNNIPISKAPDTAFYQLKGLDALKGFSALSPEMQEEWIKRQKERGIVKDDTSFEDIQQLYRNRQYADTFGREAVYTQPRELLEESFVNVAYKDAFKIKASGQPDADIISTTLDNAEISTKDLKRGYENYHTDQEILEEVDRRKKAAEYFDNPTKREDESFLEYALRSSARYGNSASPADYKSAASKFGVEEPLRDAVLNLISDSKEEDLENITGIQAYKKVAKEWRKVRYAGLYKGIKGLGTAIKETNKLLNKFGIPVGTAGGTVVYDILPEPSGEAQYSDEKPEDVEINTELPKQDSRKNTEYYKNETKKRNQVVQDFIDTASPSLTQNTYREAAPVIANMVDLGINGDEEQQKEVRENVDEILNLSNHYSAFKDRDELKDYDYKSQIDDAAMFLVDAQKYGEPVAQTRLDSRIRKRVAENQTSGQHLGNDLKNIFVTGQTSFISSAVMGMMSLGYMGNDIINSLFGEDTYYLQNFLTQDVKEDGTLKDYLYNPKYWQYVDQFNTFDSKVIAKGLANNGIASTADIYAVDGVNKWLSAQTLHEGLRMAKFAVGSAIIGNVAGAFGPAASASAVTAANVLGISESYGMQTVEQTLQKANETIESIINREANRYADEQAETNTAAIRKIAEDYIADNSDLKTDNPQYEEAVQSLMDYATNVYKSAAAQNWVEEHSEDYDYLRNQAQRAAVAAYTVDFLAEGVRMANVVPLARRYLYTKGAREWADARRLEREGIRGLRMSGANKVAANVDRWKQARKTIISGFTSNYLDDVTVGLGKGAGMGMFNDYVARTTDPSVAAMSYDRVGPIFSTVFGAISGAEEAITDPQSFYDGFIGGIGTIISGVPSTKWASTLLSGQKLSVDENGQRRNVLRLIDQIVQNPVLSAYTTAVESEYNNPIVKEINKKMTDPKIQGLFTDVGAARMASLQWEDAETLKERKDAESISFFEVVKLLNKARVDQNYAQIPQLQALIEQLNNYAGGQITDTDIDAFLAQDENKSIKGKEDSKEIARQKLQENAQKILDNLKDYTSKYEELTKALKAEKWTDESKEYIIDNLIFDTILSKDKKQRLGDIEEKLKGSKVVNNTSDRRAQYPTKELWQARVSVTRDAINQQEKRLESSIREARQTKSKEKRAALQLNIRAYQENLSELNKRLSELQADENLFDGSTDTELELITADEILSLSPEDRLAFIVGFDLYNKNQQNEINLALGKLKDKYSDEEIWEMLRDSAALNQEVDAIQKHYDRYLQGMSLLPDYVAYRQSLRGREGKRAYSLATEASLHTKLESIQADDLDANGNSLLISEANKAIRSIDIPASKQIEHYVEKHLETKEILTPLIDKLKLEDALVTALTFDNISEKEDRKLVAEIAGLSLTPDDLILGINDAIREAAANGNEHLVDVLSKALKNAENLIRQNKATVENVSEKEAEKQRKQDAFNNNGKNFGWDGFYVGQLVWDTNTNEIGRIEKFNTSEKEGESGTADVYFVRSKQTKTIKSLNDITNEKPAIDKNNQQNQKTTEEKPQEKVSVEPPVENPATKVVDPSELNSDPRGNWENPTEVVGGEEEKKAVKDAEESLVEKIKEEFVKGSEAITGNRYYEYGVEETTDTTEKGRRKQRKRKASTKYQQIFFDWLAQNKIQLQDIIDNELGNILSTNPEIELHFMAVNPSQGKELSSMPMLVVEYTKDVAQWHKKERGGVISANGKEWLLVGVAGPAANADIRSADYIGRRTQAFKNSYYKQNPNEKYFVSSDFTNVKEMTSGRIINQNLTDTESKSRSLSELLSVERNPENLKIEDLKFLIQVGDKVKTVGVSNEKVYPPNDGQSFNGAAFLLIKAANGNYIPALLSSERLESLEKGNPVRDEIENVISQLPNVDAAERRKAFQNLVQLIVNTKENGIHERENNQIAVVRDGEEKLFTLGRDFDTLDFLNEVSKLNPLINITASVLANKARLTQYINAGVIKTDIGLLGTVNASYSIYNVDNEGRPIIAQQTTGTVEGKSDYKEAVGVKIRVGNKEYVRRNGRYYDSNRSEITRDGNPETYSNIYYTDILEARQLPPTPLGEGRNLYIIDADLNNPSAVVQRPNGTFLVLDRQKSIDAINYKAKQVQEALKTKAMEEPPKPQPPTPQTKTNEFKGKSLTELQSTDNLTTFKQLFLKGTVRNTDGAEVSVRQRLTEIAKAKGWDWGSSISQREAFLKSKEIQTDNITDIESWCNNIESCK